MPTKTCQTVENPKKSECWTDIPVLNRRTWCRDRFCRRDDSSDFATAVFPRRRILLLVRLLSVWFWFLFCQLYISTLLRFIGLYASPYHDGDSSRSLFTTGNMQLHVCFIMMFFVFLQTSWQTATKSRPYGFQIYFSTRITCVFVYRDNVGAWLISSVKSEWEGYYTIQYITLTL